MQFFKNTTLLLMVTFVLFCYTSCQKDSLLFNEIATPQKYPEGESMSLYQIPEVQHAVKQLHSDRRSLVRSFSDNYEIDTTRVLKMKFNEEHTTYTLNIRHNYPGKIINLAFKEWSGTLSQPYILEYHMSPETVQKFNFDKSQIKNFEGTIRQFKYSDYIQSSYSRNDKDCGCFSTFITSGSIITGGSNGGYGSDDGSGNNNGQSNGSGNNDDSNGNSNDGTSGGHGNDAGTNTDNGGSSTNDDNSGNPTNGGGTDPPVTFGGGIDCQSIKLYFDLTGDLIFLAMHKLFCNELIITFTDSDCDSFAPGVGVIFDQSGTVRNYGNQEHNPYNNILLECLDQNITTKIDELKAQKLYDPCTGNEIKVDVDMLAKALCYGCLKSSGLTVQNLEDAYYEALVGVDYIAYRPYQFSGCPLMQCLLNNLINGKISDPLSNRICSIFQPKDNPKGLTFGMSASAFDKQPNALAGASVVKNNITNKLEHVILINPNNCNLHNDPLKLLTTIQHELIHVDIHNKLIEKYGWDGSDLTMQATFDAMILEEYPGRNYKNHHQLFIGEYMTDMLNGIRLANGGLGLHPPDINDIYLGIVLDAFPSELDFILNTLGYSKEDIDKFVKNFNTWIKENKSSKGIYNSCP